MTNDSVFEPQFDRINYEIADFIAARYDESKSIKERFFSFWTAFATYLNLNPFDLLYMDEIASSHLYPEIGKQDSTLFYAETKKIILQGQNEGLIKIASPSLINQFVRSSITKIITQNLAVGKKMEEAELKWIVEACWDGIKK